MMKLAQHIIRTKSGEFDPSMLEDHYRNSLMRILRKKQRTRPALGPAVKPSHENVVNLMDALRRSVAAERADHRAPVQRADVSARGGPHRKSIIRGRERPQQAIKKNSLSLQYLRLARIRVDAEHAPTVLRPPDASANQERAASSTR
jgi:hypothetical protein